MSTDLVVISMLVVFFVFGPLLFVFALCKMAQTGDRAIETAVDDWEKEQ